MGGTGYQDSVSWGTTGPRINRLKTWISSEGYREPWKVYEQERFVFRAHFRKLSGCRVENGLSSAKCMEVRAFVILILESSRHCFSYEPLPPFLNTSLTPQMLLLRNLRTLRTFPPP